MSGLESAIGALLATLARHGARVAVRGRELVSLLEGLMAELA